MPLEEKEKESIRQALIKVLAVKDLAYLQSLRQFSQKLGDLKEIPKQLGHPQYAPFDEVVRIIFFEQCGERIAKDKAALLQDPTWVPYSNQDKNLQAHFFSASAVLNEFKELLKEIIEGQIHYHLQVTSMAKALQELKNASRLIPQEMARNQEQHQDSKAELKSKGLFPPETSSMLLAKACSGFKEAKSILEDPRRCGILLEGEAEQKGVYLKVIALSHPDSAELILRDQDRCKQLLFGVPEQKSGRLFDLANAHAKTAELILRHPALSRYLLSRATPEGNLHILTTLHNRYFKDPQAASLIAYIAKLQERLGQQIQPSLPRGPGKSGLV